MGGRSSASGAGGGSGHVRTGRGQLPRTNNDDALAQLQRDTGYDEAKARDALHAMTEFYGGDYQKYTAGLLPDATRTATEAALRMPYYDGEVYRGVFFNDRETDLAQTFLSKWKPGSEQMFTDTQGTGKGVLQSFSSDRSSAEQFSNWGDAYTGETSIMFVMHGNRTAPGVQHLSKHGSKEAEVLSPAGQRFKVLSVTMSETSEGGRNYEIHLQDKGWRKPKY